MGEGNRHSELATFGMGCFWCAEALFGRLRGVATVRPGYCGGHVPQPTYQQVCTGDTGHVEVVQLEFDPEAISYEVLLEVFFAMHDPTTPDRQGVDVGPQYRSAIFTHSAAQHAAATEAVDALQRGGTFRNPIVTTVEPAGEFYPAEAYHVDYYAHHRRDMYCRVAIAPKLDRLAERFEAQLDVRC